MVLTVGGLVEKAGTRLLTGYNPANYGLVWLNHCTYLRRVCGVRVLTRIEVLHRPLKCTKADHLLLALIP